jgi:uncharacterized protein
MAAVWLAAPAHADPPPPGSTWSETYIDEPDGTKLHVDVLRPKGIPATKKTPVILSIGPYFNHSGQVGPLGPVEDTSYSPVGDAGPSSRFFDFVNGAKVFDRGYTYVMVDLRGFGGSNGCLDWSGPGEQADVKAAVEWAAKQPWSTGKVGMYGKSYDGVTGLIGVGLRPKGLATVVAQEPVYDLYRYLYENRVRFSNSLATPGLYDAIAGTPGTSGDTPAYQQNSLDDSARPGCPALNWADQQDRNHDTPYWRQRNLIPLVAGSKVPLFMTQGFLEDNTKPDPSAWEVFNGVAGPKRAWFGMWEHVRGNDVDEEGRLRMGRKGWFDEVMRFYDRYLLGKSSPVKDPPIALQSSDGKWRAEGAWPPKDATVNTASLKSGSYTDDGQNNGSAFGGTPPYGRGIWTFSPPLAHDAHFAGVPRVTLDVQALVPDGNAAVDLYDVDKDGSATLISRGTSLLPDKGPVSFQLYGNDWKLPAGHRLGVLVSSANAEWWMHASTGQQVTVKSAEVTLPFLGCARNAAIQGDPSIRLEDYRADAPIEVDAATIDGATDAKFPLPAALRGC